MSNNTTHLAFWLATGDRAIVLAALQDLARRCASGRWISSPPVVQEGSQDEGSDLALVYEVFDADAALSLDVERQHFDETWTVVWEVSQLSGSLGASFEVEFRGEYIGSIEHGVVDDGIRMDFLGEWNNDLSAR